MAWTSNCEYTMNYRYIAKTDPGRIRDNNEDSVAFDSRQHVAVLADGMGGYNAGEIASGMATAYIKLELSRWLAEAGAEATMGDIGRAMEVCVANANTAIFNSANSNSSYAGMGTTLVVAVFKENRLVLGHIGDSRCYRVRGGSMRQITKDHSLLQEHLDAGIVTQEEAATSSIKNLVTRALGVEEYAQLEVNNHLVELGDIYLLCSDGLSDMVDDAAIGKIAASGQALDQISDQLVAIANARGGRDNISVLMVEAVESQEKRGLMARLLGK
jgi:protein phosphatase